MSRAGGLLLVAIALCALASCGDERDEESIQQGPLEISEETTRAVGPLTDDGRVDYVAALNASEQAPLAAENAAIPLLRVLRAGLVALRPNEEMDDDELFAESGRPK